MILFMIEMPPFEYPDWYLQEVRKILVDGRLKDSRKISDSYKKIFKNLIICLER